MIIEIEPTRSCGVEEMVAHLREIGVEFTEVRVLERPVQQVAKENNDG
jgi:hypothetical protein